MSFRRRHPCIMFGNFGLDILRWFLFCIYQYPQIHSSRAKTCTEIALFTIVVQRLLDLCLPICELIGGWTIVEQPECMSTQQSTGWPHFLMWPPIQLPAGMNTRCRPDYVRHYVSMVSNILVSMSEQQIHMPSHATHDLDSDQLQCSDRICCNKKPKTPHPRSGVTVIPESRGGVAHSPEHSQALNYRPLSGYARPSLPDQHQFPEQNQ